MSRSPVRSPTAKSLLPHGIPNIPFKGRVADCLGLFGLLVVMLGLTCFLSGDPLSERADQNLMSVQGACDLQSLFFFLLGTGQLLFLRKRLPVLLSRKVSLFSPDGWYYIGVLSFLLVVLLFLLYLLIDSSHLSMAGVSLCAFLLPFTVSNAWEIFQNKRAQATAGKERIPMRAALPGGVSLLLLVGLMSLTGRQMAIARLNPDPVSLPGRSAGREVRYREAALALNVYASHLLELDARFSSLTRKDTVISRGELARARGEIKAQEYAIGRFLDSLDNRGKEFGPLTASFRSLLGGHRILSGIQNGLPPQSDSVRDPDSLR
ncbi:MAG TPA: hypothetical protein VGN00_00385 [Puia sp.]|jgi:hypothetical protein